MEQIIEFISTTRARCATLVGIPAPFPRGYGNVLFLYSPDGTTRYYVENLSYEDLRDALKLNLIDENIKVISTVVDAPAHLWGETPCEVYKNVIVVDSRLPKECLGNYEEQFLDFLSKDIDEHPENVRPVSKELWEHVEQLVQGVEVNLDEPLEDDDDF
ncbi:hypothetical protein FDG95_gp503 [Pectobacterium phage vB_PcaM_CBB]|uniref:Uncharacterized protein n=1 Tax=Pectobacterium phage vB_PcaM_CBB TaxID=2772511 RepID=A0A1L2CVK7_9CAUD|nr:hypothetical protein FDG95_gp503 [Pectobacterium phage vB_PcaM_CBB]AMM44039.1 hypothetical protein CBB_476 [Pectobacterium phage vB_PcaM_CBB]